MTDYVSVHTSEEFNSVSVQFANEHDKPFAIGERMNEVCDEAYMNGYNWDAFLNAYLSVYAPELLAELDPDPEAGSYFAHYPLTSENQAKAEKFKNIIVDLIENDEKIFAFLEEHGEEIEWD